MSARWPPLPVSLSSWRSCAFTPPRHAVTSHRAIALLAILVLTALPACSLFNTDAHVESDTSWSGSFNGRTVDGSGNQLVKMGGGTGTKCASVQKQTRAGFLTVKIGGGEEKTTTAAFGVVTVCGGSSAY